MINSRQLMILSGPAEKMKEILALTGFSPDSRDDGSSYKALLRWGGGEYAYRLPCAEQDGEMTLNGEAAFIDGIADSEVPEQVRAAVLEKWYSLQARVNSVYGGENAVNYSPLDGDRKLSAPLPSRPVEEAKNGSMVQDFDDMKRLGKDMNRMKTGQQLKEDGLIDDPIQH